MTPPNLRLWPLAHLLPMSWGQENSQEGEEQYLRHSAGRSCHAKGVREHLQGNARLVRDGSDPVGAHRRNACEVGGRVTAAHRHAPNTRTAAGWFLTLGAVRVRYTEGGSA
jgi:hypothetical protein